MDNRVYKNSNQKSRKGRKSGGKRRRGRSGRSKRGLSNSSLVGLGASRAAKWLLSMFNSEDKYVDTDNNTTYGTTYAVNLLNGLVQGTDYNNRVGISIKAVSLLCRITIRMSATAAIDSFFRIAIIRDIQANNATVAQATIFETTDFNSLVRSDWSQRFHFYMDKTYKLSLAGPSTVSYQVSIPLGFHTHYIKGQDAGTIADIATNALFVWFVSSDNTNQVAANTNFRFFYVDN
jgi:hypothetical protein